MSDILDMTRTELPLRRCVGIMLINGQGLVWTGRRIRKPHDQTTDFVWQMPQGGIDAGEEPLDAALRELAEETGITQNTQTLKQSDHWYHYELPQNLLGTALKGKYRGQSQKWFAMRFEGTEQDIDISEKPEHKAEFDQWQWRKADELINLIVPFKRQVYTQVINEFSSYLAD